MCECFPAGSCLFPSVWCLLPFFPLQLHYEVDSVAEAREESDWFANRSAGNVFFRSKLFFMFFLFFFFPILPLKQVHHKKVDLIHYLDGTSSNLAFWAWITKAVAQRKLEGNSFFFILDYRVQCLHCSLRRKSPVITLCTSFLCSPTTQLRTH